MIQITKNEAMFLQSKFPHKKIHDMYTGDVHIEKMIRRTKNHYWCTEVLAVIDALNNYRVEGVKHGE